MAKTKEQQQKFLVVIGRISDDNNVWRKYRDMTPTQAKKLFEEDLREGEKREIYIDFVIVANSVIQIAEDLEGKLRLDAWDEPTK